ncbi:MAG TPA: P1 family peptidase [Terriglobales bacterium]
MAKPFAAFVVALALAAALPAQTRPPRARDLGVPFEGTPGPNNAITDVHGVEVGYSTLIEGGDVRTGVTAILPRGKTFKDTVMAGFFSQNGNGEMTGIHWLVESGFLEGPVMITNTHSVGTVRDSVIAWEMKHGATQYPWSLPVVAETYDGYLNDINGFHVKPEHAVAAIESAAGGRVAEGNVGGGTGMVCMGFKGGSGTASRVLTAAQGGYTVGVFVQCNTGSAHELRLAGVPVGQIMNRTGPYAQLYGRDREDMGSIIIVVATDAPLTSTQLNRLCKRATLGLARIGGTSGDGSGDIFVSFSTANPGAAPPPRSPLTTHVEMMANWAMGPLFDATIRATEEAIANAMVGAQTMTGYQGHTIVALDHDRLASMMKATYAPTPW